MEGLPDSQEVRGITPNAFQTIFAHIEKSKTQQVSRATFPIYRPRERLGLRHVLETTLKGEAERSRLQKLTQRFSP